MTASKLIKPTTEYKESFLEALRLYHKEGGYTHLNINELNVNFDNFVDEINKKKSVIYRDYPDWVEPVPDTVLWLVKNEDYIGSIKVRHRLNWHLEKWGGHISLIIRPDLRLMGYGQKILRKTLPFMHALDIDKALLTMRPDNVIARHIIEKIGGIAEEDEQPGTDRFPARIRYWLKI